MSIIVSAVVMVVCVELCDPKCYTCGNMNYHWDSREMLLHTLILKHTHTHLQYECNYALVRVPIGRGCHGDNKVAHARVCNLNALSLFFSFFMMELFLSGII